MRWSRLFAFVMVLAMLLSVASAESMLPRRTETKPQLPEQINQPDSEAEPKAPEAEPKAPEAEPGRWKPSRGRWNWSFPKRSRRTTPLAARGN